MQEPSIRVMNMVRRTLLETPDVTDKQLYAAAVAIEPAIGDLTLKQFGARYPRRIRRKEMGQGSRSGPGRDQSYEGPRLYAPGGDTLLPEARPAIEAGTEPAPGAPRRAERPQEPEPVADTSKATDPDHTPWPLRIHPDAANREPRKASRLPRRVGRRPAAPEPAPVATTRGPNAPRRPAEDPRMVRRTEVRRLLFDWAREIVASESDADFVNALAHADTFVGRIEQVFDGAVPAASRAKHEAPPSPATPATTERPPRPHFEPGKRISSYNEDQLDAIVRWVSHAKRWRTRDNLVGRVAQELGFKRRGKRIRETIRTSVDRVLGPGV